MAEETVLGAVHVLELVHHDVADSAVEFLAETAAQGELLDGAADHRAKRKKAHLLEKPLVALDRVREIGFPLGEEARIEAFVIEDVDASQEDLDGWCRRHLVVFGASGLCEQIDHAEPAGDAEQKRPLLLVVRPVQGFVDPTELAEILEGPAVRGADEHAAADRGEISIARVFFGGPELDPFLELPGGLLGEGEGDEGGGLDSFGEKAHGTLR